MSRLTLFALLLLLLCGAAAEAHPGGRNSDGCHTNRKTGEYHCHGAEPGATPTNLPEKPALSKVAKTKDATPSQRSLPPGCFVGPRGGTYTFTKSGRKNYGGC